MGNRAILVLVRVRASAGVGADWYFTFLDDLETTWAVRLHVLGSCFHGFTAIAIEGDGAAVLRALYVTRRAACCERNADEASNQTKFPEFLHT